MKSINNFLKLSEKKYPFFYKIINFLKKILKVSPLFHFPKNLFITKDNIVNVHNIVVAIFILYYFGSILVKLALFFGLLWIVIKKSNL